MVWKKLEKEKKRFIYIGLPCFIFVFYVLLNFYILFAASYAVYCIAVVAALVRKRHPYNSLTRAAVLMVVIFLVINYNIFHLTGQFIRHSPGGRQNLLEPNHPELAGLNKTFYSWHQTNYGVSFDSLNETTHEELALKMERVDFWLRSRVIKWMTDSGAPYYTNDHVATLDEIFASDTNGDGILEDDCDGIAVLTVSLLLHMGYNAFVSECMSHWHTIVFPVGSDPKTIEGFEEGIHLYNSWGRPTYYIFNQTEVIVPLARPVILSMYEIFMEAGTYEDFANTFLGAEDEVGLIISILMTYGLLLVAAISVYFVVKIDLPRSEMEKKSKRKRMVQTIFNNSLIGAFAAFIIFWFAFSGLGGFGTLIIASTVVLIARYTEFRIVKDGKD